jgi:hypothetical protein
MPIRAYAIPGRCCEQAIVVWSTVLGPSDFKQSNWGGQPFFTGCIKGKFEQGMQETLGWMKLKGLEVVPDSYINFVFQRQEEPWGDRSLKDTLVAEAKGSLGERRFDIVDRAWQILDTEASVRLRPPEPGKTPSSSRGAAMEAFGLPDGLEVSILARTIEP